MLWILKLCANAFLGTIFPPWEPPHMLVQEADAITAIEQEAGPIVPEVEAEAAPETVPMVEPEAEPESVPAVVPKVAPAIVPEAMPTVEPEAEHMPAPENAKVERQVVIQTAWLDVTDFDSDYYVEDISDTDEEMWL